MPANQYIQFFHLPSKHSLTQLYNSLACCPTDKPSQSPQQPHHQDILIRSPFYDRLPQLRGPCQCEYHRQKRQWQAGRRERATEGRLRGRYHIGMAGEHWAQGQEGGQKGETRGKGIQGRSTVGVNISQQTGCEQRGLQPRAAEVNRGVQNYNNIFQGMLKKRMQAWQDTERVQVLTGFIKARARTDPNYAQQFRNLIYTQLLPVAQQVGYNTLMTLKHRDSDKISRVSRVLNCKQDQAWSFVQQVQAAAEHMRAYLIARIKKGVMAAEDGGMGKMEELVKRFMQEGVKTMGKRDVQKLGRTEAENLGTEAVQSKGLGQQAGQALNQSNTASTADKFEVYSIYADNREQSSHQINEGQLSPAVDNAASSLKSGKRISSEAGGQGKSIRVRVGLIDVDRIAEMNRSGANPSGLSRKIIPGGSHSKIINENGLETQRTIKLKNRKSSKQSVLSNIKNLSLLLQEDPALADNTQGKQQQLVQAHQTSNQLTVPIVNQQAQHKTETKQKTQKHISGDTLNAVSDCQAQAMHQDLDCRARGKIVVNPRNSNYRCEQDPALKKLFAGSGKSTRHSKLRKMKKKATVQARKVSAFDFIIYRDIISSEEFHKVKASIVDKKIRTEEERARRVYNTINHRFESNPHFFHTFLDKFKEVLKPEHVALLTAKYNKYEEDRMLRKLLKQVDQSLAELKDASELRWRQYETEHGETTNAKQEIREFSLEYCSADADLIDQFSKYTVIVAKSDTKFVREDSHLQQSQIGEITLQKIRNLSELKLPALRSKSHAGHPTPAQPYTAASEARLLLDKHREVLKYMKCRYPGTFNEVSCDIKQALSLNNSKVQ